WALIHLENLWEENPLTLEGRFLHQRVDESGTEVRGSLRIVRALPIRSMRHGLVGKADVVEFHRVPKDENSQHQAISLKNATGLWAPVPVEYKRGRPKFLNCDKIQLCAQALCLEEMLNLHIPEGRIFYGKTQKRLEVLFDHPLREDTRKWIIRLHEQSQR
ncbi:CRISPR-associated protein Cas4, partial [candidate division KSB1 bacterium]|nr:CRISPR-associated protein Cas4 [candidate division KSB1 bacterium]NIS27866.1 CRISPR-associated protein Cas4 [candidate division KSB1 bacterium]NIT74749.1 CRISPR-associated protein Cas4 [candidate division KSB1 bacterium]NIU28531.1 CRISPR-associated protein Cas4 [candidate division KSB1 bacterium]NIU94334.1 CRISPR-associated protein Cas4 [candidate division KSB1 bacterium]